jgi:urea transport system substrate-binding protein
MGGILGRKIKVIRKTVPATGRPSPKRPRSCWINDRVAAVFGCWTSASRKAVLPVFEKDNGLLYYPTFYEGLEQSKNVIYTGQEATQQILAAWTGPKEKKAKTFFLVGSDYIWPRTSNKIARKHIENVLKGKVVGEEYYPLGNTKFGSLINKIKLKSPTHLRRRGGRLQRGLLQAAQGRRRHRRQAPADHLGDRGRNAGHRRRERRRLLPR